MTKTPSMAQLATVELLRRHAEAPSAPPVSPAPVPEARAPAAPPDEAAERARRSRRRRARFAAAGGMLVAASAPLPWMSTLGFSRSALDTPVSFIAQQNDAGALGDVKIGLVVLVLGALGAALSFVRPLRRLRAACGLLAVLLATAFVKAVADGLAPAGAGAPSVLGSLGPGLWAAAAGGIVLLVAPPPRRRP